MVREGRVAINGRIVTRMGVKIDPGHDRVSLDGVVLSRRASKAVVLAMYKPRGVITTASDPEGRKTVYDVLMSAGWNAAKVGRVFYVGRLDFNSEGLLLLTSDGALAHALTHPSGGVQRVYRVKVSGRVDDDWLSRIVDGVELEDGFARAERVEVVRRLRNATWLEMQVREGRNRLVRRLMASGGYLVRRLVRVSYAGVELGGMRPGQVRMLEHDEQLKLRRACGMVREAG